MYKLRGSSVFIRIFIAVTTLFCFICLNLNTYVSAENAQIIEIPQNEMTAITTSEQSGNEARYAVDNNDSTIWHTNWSTSYTPLPHSITIKFANTYNDVYRLRYKPRQDQSSNGIITKYEIYSSDDGENYAKVGTGVWKGDKSEKIATFSARSASSIMLKALESVSDPGKSFASAATIRVERLENFKVDITKLQSAVNNATELINGFSEDPALLKHLNDAVSVGKSIIDGRSELQETIDECITNINNEAKLLANVGKLDHFEPGSVWVDNHLNPIQAHGGGILFDKGTYYWYGENKDFSGFTGTRMDVIGVSCYSSKDLYNWKYEGLALPAVSNDPSSDLYPANVLERPKVIYNDLTKKYVMWMHIDSADYKYARAGVAISDSPIGPFTYIGSERPDNSESRDMTVFKDTDGKAYHIYSSEGNGTLHISLLTDDYLHESGTYVRVFEKWSREAPAMFKHKDKYFLITSGCSGWSPNAASYAVSDSPMGPWTIKNNPCLGPNADLTFLGQSTFVLPLPGYPDSFIFMADRWNANQLWDSRYLWLPIKINGDDISINWTDKWNLSALGMYTPTTNLAFGKTIEVSSSMESSGWYKNSATDAEYGSVDNSMGWSSSSDAAGSNHTEWIEIDLGGMQSINRVDLYPRNDSLAGEGFPIDFVIKGFDGVEWKNLKQIKDYNKPASGAQTFKFSYTNAQKVRIEGTNLRYSGALNGYYLQFAEVGVYNGASFSMIPQSLLMHSNESAKLSISDPLIQNESLLWYSDSPNIISVDGFGNISARQTGTANVTALMKDGSGSAVCTISVNPYQASEGYLYSQGPFWRYQYVTSGSNDYKDYKQSVNGVWWENAQYDWEHGSVGKKNMVPGSGSVDSVRSFSVLADGTIRISANENIVQNNNQADYSGDGVKIKIMKDNIQIWPETGWKTVTYGSPVVFSNLDINVKAGEKIYFICNKNGFSQGDELIWDPVISYAPDNNQKISFEKVNMHLSDDLSSVDVSTSIVNNFSSIPLNATIIASLYDYSNNLISLKAVSQKSYSLVKNVHCELRTELLIPSSFKNGYVKVLIWDNSAGLVPLANEPLAGYIKSLNIDM